MRIIVFDTETTGYAPGNICQLSYIIDDDGDVSSKNLYFSVAYVEPGAQKLHGLSVAALTKLSGGQTFESHADEILSDFESCDCWISHNFNFDKSFLFAEFRRVGVKPRINNFFCTMKYFTPICKLPPSHRDRTPFEYKYPRLSELAEFMGVSEKEIAKRASEIFEMTCDGKYHDARIDTTAVYMCYKKALEMNLIKQ
ncbi:MAG: 3'-5' exonuclease [Oscillospiraceae bacterium]|nr:3'-5' exonuclease [Oscillospiraceae bacterium]